MMSRPSSWLRIAEVAARLSVTSGRVYELMRDGHFILRYHYVKRPGLGPRFHSERLEEWIRGDQPEVPQQRAHGRRSKVNLAAAR
jgi:hypothetical protein